MLFLWPPRGGGGMSAPTALSFPPNLNPVEPSAPRKIPTVSPDNFSRFDAALSSNKAAALSLASICFLYSVFRKPYTFH
jgi:hypothetical protein